MGLDMYAYSVPAEYVIDDFNFEKKDQFPGGGVVEIAYWRKHRHLHNYMEQLYRKKGGSADSFNCTPVRLNNEDLEELEKLILSEELGNYGTPGFFFGSSGLYEFPEDRERDLAFTREAQQAIQDGKSVYYDSWW